MIYDCLFDQDHNFIIAKKAGWVWSDLELSLYIIVQGQIIDNTIKCPWGVEQVSVGGNDYGDP